MSKSKMGIKKQPQGFFLAAGGKLMIWRTFTAEPISLVAIFIIVIVEQDSTIWASKILPYAILTNVTTVVVFIFGVFISATNTLHY